MILDPPGDPTDMWLHSERYVCAGAKSYSRFSTINEVEQKYRPESETPDFELSCVDVHQSDSSRFICTTHALSPSMQLLYAPSPNDLRLPIHPATAPLLDAATRTRLAAEKALLRLRVSPTSSTRTVFVHAANHDHKTEPHSLKMHFPGRISRFTRRLTRRDVELQLWVSQQLQDAKIAHLADVAGGSYTTDDASIGFLLRARRPDCAIKDPMFMISGFALYAGDHQAVGDPPLLAQLPSLFNQDPTSFVLDRIVAPVVRLWVRTVKTLGIVPELHGQNVLFCFDDGYGASDVSMRDCDLFVDAQWRSALGLDSPDHLLEPDENTFRAQRSRLLSLCYDGFLVSNFLKAVAACAEKQLGIRQELLREGAIDAFAKFGGGDLDLPARAYYFNNRLYSDRQFGLTSRKSRALWR